MFSTSPSSSTSSSAEKQSESTIESDFVAIPPSTSSDEEKSTSLSTVFADSTWAYLGDTAVQQELYDKVGVIAIAPSDQASRIHNFDTKNFFSLAGETFLYGEKRTIQGCDLWLRLSFHFCLMSDDVKPAPGNLYLSKKNGCIAYTVVTPTGETVRDIVIESLKAPEPFNIENLKKLEKEILKETSEARHTPFLQSFDEDTRQKARELNTPILTFEGGTFTMYGDEKGNGQWGYTKITKCHDSLKKLPFKEGIAKRSHPLLLSESLKQTLKEGHAAFDKELAGSVEQFAKADALMQQLQAVAYHNEPRSDALLALLIKSYKKIESNFGQYWIKKTEQGIRGPILNRSTYQKQNCYQIILSVMTVIYGYTEEMGNTRVIYRTSRSIGSNSKPLPPKHPKEELSPLPRPIFHYKTDTWPAPFLPLRMTDGLLPDGLADDVAARIFPLEIVMGEKNNKIKYSSNILLTEFFFSYSLFGSNLVGTLTDGTEVPITVPINIPDGQQIEKVEHRSPDVFDFEQFETVKLMSLVMERLGGRSFQVVCQLRWIEDLVGGAQLFLSGKITLIAFEMLIQTVKIVKETVSEFLIDFFADITSSRLSIFSPFDNLIGDSLANNESSLAMSFLHRLNFRTDSRASEREILEHCLKLLNVDPQYLEHVEIWQSFIRMTARTPDHMWTIEKMFIVANVVAAAIAAYGRPPFGLVWMLLCSNMHTLELANVYLRRSDDYNSILALTFFNPVVALNAPDIQQQRRQEGINSRFRDTAQQGAYHLISGPLFFKQACRNGAASVPMSVQAVLSEVEKSRKDHPTRTPH